MKSLFMMKQIVLFFAIEDSSKFVGTNLFYRDSSDYWTFNPNNLVSTDVFDGMQIEIDPGVEIPSLVIQNLVG